jgi:hypothetical protein
MFNNTLKSEKIFDSELWNKGGLLEPWVMVRLSISLKTMLKIREINKEKII